MNTTSTRRKAPAMGNGYSLSVHDAIRAAIGRNGGKISDIARRSGMSADYLYKRLRNELPFTVTDIERICDALDIDPYELLKRPAPDDHAPDLIQQLKRLTSTVADMKEAVAENTTTLTNLTGEQRERIARERIMRGVMLAANHDQHMQDEIDHAGERP